MTKNIYIMTLREHLLLSNGDNILKHYKEFFENIPTHLKDKAKSRMNYIENELKRLNKIKNKLYIT